VVAVLITGWHETTLIEDTAAEIVAGATTIPPQIPRVPLSCISGMAGFGATIVNGPG
jgi:hypothetical protein